MLEQTIINSETIRGIVQSIQITGRESNLHVMERRMGFSKGSLENLLKGKPTLLPTANKVFQALVKYYQVNPNYLLKKYEPVETGIKNGCRVFTSEPSLVSIDNDYHPDSKAFSNN